MGKEGGKRREDWKKTLRQRSRSKGDPKAFERLVEAIDESSPAPQRRRKAAPARSTGESGVYRAWTVARTGVYKAARTGAWAVARTGLNWEVVREPGRPPHHRPNRLFSLVALAVWLPLLYWIDQLELFVPQAGASPKDVAGLLLARILVWLIAGGILGFLGACLWSSGRSFLARQGHRLGGTLVALVGFELLRYAALPAGASWQLPGPLDLLPAMITGFLGAGLALSLDRPGAYLVRTVGILTVVGLTGAFVVGSALEEHALVETPYPVSRAQQRTLLDRLERHDPRTVPEGETTTLMLSEAELNQLIASGARLTGLRPATRLIVHSGRFHLAVTLPLFENPAQYVNLEVEGRFHIEDGTVSGGLDRLRLGRARAPGMLLRAGSALARVCVQYDRRLRDVWDRLGQVALVDAGMVASYQRIPETAALRRLFPRFDARRLNAHLAHLDGLRARGPAGTDARFRFLVQEAFAFAAARGGPEAENRAAILALGIRFGHRRLARLAGLPEQPKAEARVSLLGRNDLARHFLVSAGLAVVGHAATSDVVGVLKEELDAAGGSGFSYADLLADRAGIRLAVQATASIAGARQWQGFLTRPGFRASDVMPDIEGLPEGFQQDQLPEEAERQRLDAEIERRIRQLPAP